MSREGALLIAVALAVLVVVAMAWGWRRRSRRDAALIAPTEIPAHAASLLRVDGLYVATSRAGAPLDRLAIRGFAIRSKVTVEVTDRGIALALTGQPTVFLPADRLRTVGRATWTIDRVVESGGLVLLTWSVTDDMDADTVLRLPEGQDEAFLVAARTLLPIPTPSGDAA